MILTFGKYKENTQEKDYLAMQFLGTDKYYLNPELKEIVNIAMAMEKPLLVTGEAGTGKTQLAFQSPEL